MHFRSTFFVQNVVIFLWNYDAKIAQILQNYTKSFQFQSLWKSVQSHNHRDSRTQKAKETKKTVISNNVVAICKLWISQSLLLLIVKKERKKKIYKEMVAIGTKRGASDSGELLAGIDVFDDRFVETGEVFVALFQHRLYPVWLHLKPHSRSDLQKPNASPRDECRLLHFFSLFLSLSSSKYKPQKTLEVEPFPFVALLLLPCNDALAFGFIFYFYFYFLSLVMTTNKN